MLWKIGGHASCFRREAHMVSPCPVKDLGAAESLGAGLTKLLAEAVHLGTQEPSTPRASTVGMLVLHQTTLLSPSLPYCPSAFTEDAQLIY